MSDITGYEIIGEQMRAKDAEIAQLKNIIRATEVERDAADKVCETLKAANASFEGGMHWRNGLITELCDALQMRVWPNENPRLERSIDRKHKELLQRAREATR